VSALRECKTSPVRASITIAAYGAAIADIGAMTNIQTAKNTKSPKRAGVVCRTFTMNLPMSASGRRLFDWPYFD
jgi:hypothetical protein